MKGAYGERDVGVHEAGNERGGAAEGSVEPSAGDVEGVQSADLGKRGRGRGTGSSARKAQSKASMVWSFGKLEVRETALMKDPSARAREGLEEFTAQHGASTARKRGRPRPQSLCYRSGLCST